jgi:uncharacterized membrane protein
MDMRAAQLRYDAMEAEPALDDRRVLYLHDLLEMLREELEDSIQRAKDLRERISDIEEELREGQC